MDSLYICPSSKTRLTVNSGGDALISTEDLVYPILAIGNGIPNFLSAYSLGDKHKYNLSIYDKPFSVERYSNELTWLYKTFGEDEKSFRERNIERLEVQKGQRILVTGCGIGSDILPLAKAVGKNGQIYAQDLSPEMVLQSAKSIENFSFTENIHLSISDAQSLPFSDGFFDGVFHFGGLNLFSDIGASIIEMTRVTKFDGKVVFGDESVAPWLRSKDYGKAAICNNSLWNAKVPLDLLPENATDVNLSWVFGNCFYLISFTVSETGPYMNMNVPHIGPRGGSMRTRYFGKLEGINEELKERFITMARSSGVSVVELLEEVLKEKILENTNDLGKD